MRSIIVLATIWSFMTAGLLTAAPAKMVLEAEDATLQPARTEIVEQSSFPSGKGVALTANADSQVDSDDAEPDLTFAVKASAPGRYVVRTRAAVDTYGRALMEKAKSKHESMFMKIAVGEGRPARRVVFVPWATPESNVQTIGKYDLTGEEEPLRIWLPKGVRLDYVEIIPYTPPKVPEAAANYRPPITPPPSRPRLWVNAETLPQVRQNLTRGENAAQWEKVQEAAAEPFEFNPEPGTAVEYDPALETAVVNKAFVYLMTGDKKAGREAITLARDYLSVVEFSNLLDITREIGRAMYAGARVYDWCYDLMTEEERESLRSDFMRLADDMEIGWPPFKQGVVNGHGSEAQLFSHLLSMAIAIYDEDPVPYQYCAYRVLEELVPMRNFEYQSPRHHQGIGYGIYRFAWDMHAALLFQRMSGQKIFDSGIEHVHKHWLYMRLPNGETLPDGDGNVDGRKVNLGMTALLAGAYTGDPILKYEFLRQGGLPHDPILVLLLNDPDLEPAEGLASLPLTLDFGHVLGGMVARTGWDMGKATSNVIVAMTGGGYHFANHQHADAGSFQVYFRGVQVADLGQYVFYGTPYDMNFNKRSISHSMMLAYDPDEKVGKRQADGGTRFGFRSPGSVNTVKTYSDYANGDVLSTDFGPDKQTPDYSYFSVNLTSAYSDKIKDYVRTFCFLNLHDEQTPAALIVLDNMETSSPEIQKYWQVNTLNPPQKTADGVILTNSDFGTTGNVVLQMFRPAPEDRQLEILSGKDANSVFGTYYDPPQPDRPTANGHRIMFSPAKPSVKDTFLTVLTMSDADQTTLPVDVTETSDTFVLSIGDRVVVLSKTGKLMSKGFTVDIKPDGDNQLLLTGLQPGQWNIKGNDGSLRQELQVQEARNTGVIVLPKGQYTVEPARYPTEP